MPSSQRAIGGHLAELIETGAIQPRRQGDRARNPCASRARRSPPNARAATSPANESFCQNEGKKMRQFGKVDIPQEAFRRTEGG
jgi:hypothetical protein